ncbi:hypothetical protein U2060_15135, partial [Listeria monocytogenes]|uniref:hypothetical protein n=1 Tax=Listeria monocytogenes TaxID=1639 RepID=UPI002FDBB62A
QEVTPSSDVNTTAKRRRVRIKDLNDEPAEEEEEGGQEEEQEDSSGEDHHSSSAEEPIYSRRVPIPASVRRFLDISATETRPRRKQT